MSKALILLALLDAITEAAREVGNGFNRGDLWLPELVGAARAMSHAMPIRALEELNLRHKTKIAVGGGAVTQEFANEIGVDGYRPTATMAVELFKEFVTDKPERDVTPESK